MGAYSMDSISTANALSLLTKWHDEASVVAFDHGQTGKSCKSWVLVREVISGKNPSVTFLMLHDPFPLRQLSLAKAEFEYGDCLLYTSDAADDLPCVDLGGRRI